MNLAGQGRDDACGPVLSNGGVLDLRPALAATAWTGTAAAPTADGFAAHALLGPGRVGGWLMRARSVNRPSLA